MSCVAKKTWAKLFAVPNCPQCWFFGRIFLNFPAIKIDASFVFPSFEVLSPWWSTVNLHYASLLKRSWDNLAPDNLALWKILHWTIWHGENCLVPNCPVPNCPVPNCLSIISTVYLIEGQFDTSQFGTGQYAMHWQTLLTVKQNSLQVPTDVQSHQHRYKQIKNNHT